MLLVGDDLALGIQQAFPNYMGEGFARDGITEAPFSIDPTTPAIDLWLAQERPNKRRLGIYSPSSLGGCRKKMWYWRMGETEPKEHMSAATRKRLDLGTVMHRQLDEYFHQCFDDFESEVKVAYPPLHLYGSTDGIRRSIRRMYEFKTTNFEALKKMRRPLDKHMLQGTSYMFCKDIPTISIIYVDVSTSGQVSWVEFVCRFNFTLWEGIVAGLVEIECCVQRRISDGLADPSRFECSTCPFSWTCQEGQTKW